MLVVHAAHTGFGISRCCLELKPVVSMEHTLPSGMPFLSGPPGVGRTHSSVADRNAGAQNQTDYQVHKK